MIQVTLLEHTPEPERVVAMSARLCYSPSGAAELSEKMTPETVEKMVKMLVEMGHASTLEHVSFTFGIEGVSRTLTHQLVRHRIASYSQQSQRYVAAHDFAYITPPSIAEKPEAKEKFDALMSACRTAIRKPSNSISELIDLESAAKLYLINELGKNWDSGVSSTFLTYKQDENGKYKFFGSPVWDYDNSLGNAVGVGSDLNNIGVTDYQQYTGWWCRYKGKSKSETMSYNIINNLARNQEVLEVANRVWFEEFMPAINHFAGKTNNAAVSSELYSSDKYYNSIADSAAMNYTSGWLLNTGSWIAARNPMRKAEFDFYTGTYTTAKAGTRYSSSFKGMYNYAVDWMLNRSAWLSNEMYADYNGSKVRYDVNRDGVFDMNDVTDLQRGLAEFTELTALQADIADTAGDGLSVSDVTFLQRVKAGYIE